MLRNLRYLVYYYSPTHKFCSFFNLQNARNAESSVIVYKKNLMQLLYQSSLCNKLFALVEFVDSLESINQKR